MENGRFSNHPEQGVAVGEKGTEVNPKLEKKKKKENKQSEHITHRANPDRLFLVESCDPSSEEPCRLHRGDRDWRRLLREMGGINYLIPRSPRNTRVVTLSVPS